MSFLMAIYVFLQEKKFEEEQQKEIEHLKSLNVYQFLG